MKRYALMALVVISIIVLMGCTGCDANPQGSSIDLTGDRTLLCNPLGWVAQEDTYEMLDFVKMPRTVHSVEMHTNEYVGLIVCELLDSSGDQIQANYINEEEGPPFVDFSTGSFSIRITASDEGSQPTLTLKNLDPDADLATMYFSLAGGEPN